MIAIRGGKRNQIVLCRVCDLSVDGCAKTERDVDSRDWAEALKAEAIGPSVGEIVSADSHQVSAGFGKGKFAFITGVPKRSQWLARGREYRCPRNTSEEGVEPACSH